jgi:hypothetical protein
MSNRTVKSAAAALKDGAAEGGTQTQTADLANTANQATDAAEGSVSTTPRAAKAKSMYRVGDCPVLHDHETYLPGSKLSLTQAEAERLGDKVTPADVTCEGVPA